MVTFMFLLGLEVFHYLKNSTKTLNRVLHLPLLLSDLFYSWHEYQIFIFA